MGSLTMQNVSLRTRSADISVGAAWLAMSAIVAYQVLLIALIFLRADLAVSWHTISEWAIGPYGWMMSEAFLVSALSYGALFTMLRSQVRGMLGRTGLGILLICAISATGVGVFTTDPMPMHLPLSSRGTLHVIFGTAQLVLLPFAALLINISLSRNETWRAAKQILLWTAGLPLFGFLGFVVYSAVFVFPLGRDAYGPGVNIGWPPRFAFLTYMLWVVALSWQAIRCSRWCSPQPNSQGGNHHA